MEQDNRSAQQAPRSEKDDAPPLEVRDVTLRFGSVTAVEGISLVVDRGDIVVVIGGSGAGKTTLLKLMIGLVQPTSGDVLVEGRSLPALPERELREVRKKFGMVFQHSALLDSLSVMDNVALPLREHTKLSRQEIETKVLELLASLDLKGTESRIPSELSGGMKKRVGLARALILEPSIVMYDEPTSGLDPITARLVDDLILETRDRYGVTSVVISHDMAQAIHIGDRLHLMDRGKLVISGTPAELQRQTTGLAQRFFAASGLSGPTTISKTDGPRATP